MKKVAVLTIFFLLAASQGLCGQEVITDAAGRRVRVPENVSRLVTTFKPATLLVLCLGGADALAGLDSSSRHDPLSRAVAPGISELPGVGSKSGGINLETVLSLDPDLVVLHSQNAGIRLAERLEESGCTALVIAPETFDSMKHSLAVLAEALGRPERGKRVINAMNRVQDLAASRVRDLAEPEKKKVYYAGPSGFFTTATSEMLQDVMINRAGGKNAAAGLRGHFRRISPEQLIAWAPDSIVINRLAKPRAEKVLEEKRYSVLPAVCENEIHVFPSTLAPWDFPSPLSALGVLWLGARLYPERFKDISVTEEADRFHEELFGKSFSGMGGRLDDIFPGNRSSGGHHPGNSREGKSGP